VGWKIETGVSRRTSSVSCPVAYTSTARDTSDATSSMIEDNRSATSTMPSGCGQSPTHSTTGAVSVSHTTTPATTQTPATAVNEIARCTWELRPARKVAAAPTRHSSIGTASRLFIRSPHPRRCR